LSVRRKGFSVAVAAAVVAGVVLIGIVNLASCFIWHLVDDAVPLAQWT
jgi:hypothetical protein